MAKPFDAVLKQLLETDPVGWVRQAGMPVTAATVRDADLSTSVAADKVVLVTAPAHYVAHLEFQASDDPTLPGRMLLYNALLRYQHKLPVRSTVFLLRPEAEGRAITGHLQYREARDAQVDFRYRIIRVWALPVAEVLAGSLGVLPLAPLMDVPEAALSGVIHRMEERIEREASAAEARELWASAYILLGLRYSLEFAGHLLRGVRQMKESSTYQAILREGEARGRAEGERSVILRQGSKRFGAPTKEQRAALEAITAIERLEQLAERLLEVESWEELLA